MSLDTYIEGAVKNMPSNQGNYILGLPRSRTYWFSQLINELVASGIGANSKAYHEMVRSLISPTVYYMELTRPGYNTVDCTNIPLPPLKGVKVVMILRPLSEVVSSLLALPAYQEAEVTTEQIASNLDKHFDKLVKYTNSVTDSMVIDYKDLSDSHVCAKVLVFIDVIPPNSKHALEIIEEYQSKVLTAPYIQCATANDMRNYAQLIIERYGSFL